MDNIKTSIVTKIVNIKLKRRTITEIVKNYIIELNEEDISSKWNLNLLINQADLVMKIALIH